MLGRAMDGPPSPTITAGDVAGIVAMPDPILRNLWITQAYADLSSRLHAAIGDVDHTWCGFAVWASATAGQSIRRQELPAILADVLGASDEHQACIDAINERFRTLRRLRIVPELHHIHVLRAFDEAVDAVSDHIAHGNTLVFSELVPLFVALLELLEAGVAAAITPAALDAALDAASVAPVDTDVRKAFGLYLRAAGEPDQRRRAVTVLAANVLAVAHEQRRLQADIAAAVDAGLLSAEDVTAELLPKWVPGAVVRMIAGRARRPIEILLRAVWEDAATEMLMTLRVPGAALRLSRTLPPLPDGQLFPADLADFGDGDGDEAAPYREWDRTHGTGHNDGADDWVVLAQRMNYIVNLFRSRQQDAALTVAPFVASQLDVMRSGRVPPPPLLPSRHPAPPDTAIQPP